MSDSILAAVLGHDAVAAKFERLALPELRSDEVLVRISGCGICHADLIFRNGHIPIQRPVILGHEGSGHVEQVGSAVTSVRIGDPVVLTSMSCGECRGCVNGEPYNCWQKWPANVSGRRLDGSTALKGLDGNIGSHFSGQSSFATYSVANKRNIVKVRADAPIQMLGPLGCGIQTGAGAVFNLLKPRPGQSLTISGGGSVGLSAVLAGVILRCAPIIVIEPNPARRRLALGLGATHVIDPAACDDVVTSIKNLTNGGPDKALDTSGRLDMMTAIWQSLASGGALVLVGSNVLDAALPVTVADLINRGITLHGGATGNRNANEFIPYLVDLFMDGRFPFDRLITLYPFSDLERALEDQEQGRAIKPILTMG